jgi:hypothetical protein
MHRPVCSSSVSTRPHIRTCKHILGRGSLCRGAAIRGRSYCRHHLRNRISLRRMARFRRKTCVPRISFVDAAAIRQSEIQIRIALAAGHIDRASGSMLFWTLNMARNLVRLPHRSEHPEPQAGCTKIARPKSNRINQVPLSHLDL